MNQAEKTLLYIVRHAEAGEHGDPQYPDDSLRPVTKRGRKRFRRLVKTLVKRGLAPAVIATSPFVRSRQTADAMAEVVPAEPQIHELHDLEPGGRLEPLVTWSAGQDAREIAWVGHAPDVSQLAADLIGAKPEAIRFAKGAVAAIEFAGPIAAGAGELLWLVTPKA